MESTLFGIRNPTNADENSYKTPASGTSGSKPTSATSVYSHGHHSDSLNWTELHRGHTHDPLAQVGSQFDSILETTYTERLSFNDFLRNAAKSYHAATKDCTVQRSTNSIAGSLDIRRSHRNPKTLQQVGSFDRLEGCSWRPDSPAGRGIMRARDARMDA
jgi:hypothetical protein